MAVVAPAVANAAVAAARPKAAGGTLGLYDGGQRLGRRDLWCAYQPGSVLAHRLQSVLLPAGLGRHLVLVAVSLCKWPRSISQGGMRQ